MADSPLKVKRNGDAVWRVIDGEVVILLPHESALHALSGCGGRIWELMENEVSTDDIVETICNEYDVEPQRAGEEISDYINKLEDLKLVEVTPVKEKEQVH